MSRVFRHLAHEQRQREGAQAGQDQVQGRRMIPHGDRRGKLCHRSLSHTDGDQEWARRFRNPSGHRGPCAGITLLQSLWTCNQASPAIAVVPE